MTYSAELINEWLKETGESATVLAEKLNVHRSLISRIRKGLQHLTNDQALIIADSLGHDDVEVLSSLMQEKAKSEREKSVWLKLASQGTAAIATGILVVPHLYSGLGYILC